MLVRFQTGAPGRSPSSPTFVRSRGPIGDGYQPPKLTPRPLGRDLGSAWSPKPGSGVQFLGSPPAKVQGGLGPARPHKPGTRSVRFRPLQLEERPRAAIQLIPHAGLISRKVRIHGEIPWWRRTKNALADRVSHVCKSAAVWWDGRRALPFKRRRRRTRPVTGGGPFKSVGGLSTRTKERR
jgi:hypothetical protein